MDLQGLNSILTGLHCIRVNQINVMRNYDYFLEKRKLKRFMQHQITKNFIEESKKQAVSLDGCSLLYSLPVIFHE